MRKCSVSEDKECLPDIIECENLLDWNNYLDRLYETVFKKDFLLSFPVFNGLRVIIRREPMDGKYERAFIHMTHRDYFHTAKDPNDREPDFRRSERISWIRRLIENYTCNVESNCGNILYWEQMFRGYVRSNLLFKDEMFLIVLEKRNGVYLFITSFYLDDDFELEKRLKKHRTYIGQKQKAPLA